MNKPRHWIKLWISWLTTPAHAELSGGAFGLGPLLLLLATWDGEYGSGGWLVAADGAPLSPEALCRLTHRKSVAALNGELAELERCGTLHRRVDGAWGFPRFGHWQETAAAKRMRVHRRSERHGGRNSDANSYAHGDAGCDAQRLRRETVEDPSGPPIVPQGGDENTPPANDLPGEEPPLLLLATEPTEGKGKGKAKGRPKKPRLAAPPELEAHVLAELQRACLALNPRTSGPRRVTEEMRDNLAKLHAACEPTADEWTTVIRHRLVLDQLKAGFGSLSWDSLCCPSNFRRWLHEAQTSSTPRRSGPAEVSSRPTASGVVDLKARALASRESSS